MEAAIGTLERILSTVSTLVCGAIALAAWVVLDVVPSDHRWIAQVVMWLFGLVAVAKSIETGMRAFVRWRVRQAAEKRRRERDAASLAEAILRAEERKAEVEREARAAMEQAEALRREEDEKRAAILRRLEYLSLAELTLFDEAIQKRQQTVVESVLSPLPKGLAQKHLLLPPAGTQVTAGYGNLPWLIPDFVWEELLKREKDIARRLREASKAARG